MNIRIAASALIVVGLWACPSSRAAELGRSEPPVIETASVWGPATGLQIALFPPVQLFNENYDVMGLRVDVLWGLNRNVRGLDLGLCNVARGRVEGAQLGLANVAGDLSGLQIGVYNAAGTSEFGGCQLGLLNDDRDVAGAQFGLFNFARRANGLQFGLFNMCDEMYGVQIGLLNFINHSDFLIFCPIVNAQF